MTTHKAALKAALTRNYDEKLAVNPDLPWSRVDGTGIYNEALYRQHNVTLQLDALQAELVIRKADTEALIRVSKIRQMIVDGLPANLETAIDLINRMREQIMTLIWASDLPFEQPVDDVYDPVEFNILSMLPEPTHPHLEVYIQLAHFIQNTFVKTTSLADIGKAFQRMGDILSEFVNRTTTFNTHLMPLVEEDPIVVACNDISDLPALVDDMNAYLVASHHERKERVTNTLDYCLNEQVNTQLNKIVRKNLPVSFKKLQKLVNKIDACLIEWVTKRESTEGEILTEYKPLSESVQEEMYDVFLKKYNEGNVLKPVDELVFISRMYIGALSRPHPLSESLSPCQLTELIRGHAKVVIKILSNRVGD